MTPAAPARLDLLLREEQEAAAALESLLARSHRTAIEGCLRRLAEGHRSAFQLLESRGGRLPPPAVPSLESLGPLTRHWDRALEPDLSPAALVATLRLAESACLRSHESVLHDPALGPADRVLLISILLPQQRSHTLLLERLARLV